MPGIKRRVDSGNDRDGKRAKVKDAAASSAAKGSKKNYLPPAFQKKGITRGSRKMNKDKKLIKASQKNGSSKRVQKEEDVDDDEEDDSEDSDSVDDSDIEMDDEQDAIEEEQEDAESEDGDVAESSGNGENSNNAENSRALFPSQVRTTRAITLTLLLYLQKALLASLMPNKGPLPRNARQRNRMQILSHDRRNYGNDSVASLTCLAMSARHWSPNSTKLSLAE